MDTPTNKQPELTSDSDLNKPLDVSTLIIVPAYNEQESLPCTIESLRSSLAKSAHAIDFVVVNDGSRDNTAQICHKYGVKVLSHPLNAGLTAAMQTGLKYAYLKGYDCVMQLDADGQHDPAYIDSLIDISVAQSCDIVIGSRFVNNKKDHSMRMIGSRLLTGIIRLTSGIKINDPTSGFRLYGRNIIERYHDDAYFSPEPDTLAYVARKGARIIETPVVMSERIAGTSYLTAWKSAAYMAKMFFSILLFQWVRNEPCR